jgi:hypothetical protein
MAAAADREGGETLLEIIVAVTVLGLAITALLGGLATAVFGSSLHRRQADVSVVMTSAVEWVKQQRYVACATKSSYLDTFAYPGYTVGTTPADGITIERPAGTPVWRVTFAIRDWNGGEGFDARIPAVCQASHEAGIRRQEITITVATADGKVFQSVPIVKHYRDCAPAIPLPSPGCETAP